MNYIKQLEAFYSSLNYNSLSSNAIAIYSAILHIAHIAKRYDELSIANKRLLSISSTLTVKQLQAARNELIIKNYLEYKKGRNQNEAPKYSIIKLYESLEIKNRTTGRTCERGSGLVSTRATGRDTNGVY